MITTITGAMLIELFIALALIIAISFGLGFWAGWYK